jgi:nitrous oxide reductase accessory protein NosL
MRKVFLLILAGGIMMTACKKEDKEMPTNSVFNPYDDQASKNSK